MIGPVWFLAIIVLGAFLAGFVLVVALLGKRGIPLLVGGAFLLGLALIMGLRGWSNSGGTPFPMGPRVEIRHSNGLVPPAYRHAEFAPLAGQMGVSAVSRRMISYLVIVVLPLAGFALAMVLSNNRHAKIVLGGLAAVVFGGVCLYWLAGSRAGLSHEVAIRDELHFGPRDAVTPRAPAPRPPINLERANVEEQTARAEIPVNEPAVPPHVASPEEQPLQVSNHRFLSDGKQQSEDVHSIPAWVSEDLNLRPHNPNQLDLVISSGRYSTKPEAYAELLQLLDRAIRTYYGKQDERLSHVNFPLEQSRLQGSTIMQEAVVAWPFTTKGEQYRMYQIHWQVQLDGGLKQQLVAIANDTTVLQRLKVLGAAAGGLTLLFAGAAWATRKRQAA